MHDQFQERLNELVEASKKNNSTKDIGHEALGQVLARVFRAAPDETTRLEISEGWPESRRLVDQGRIPQGTVSKAVTALISAKLLTEEQRKVAGGRWTGFLKLGPGLVTAGCHVVQHRDVPVAVTTALFDIGNGRILNERTDALWEQPADKCEPFSDDERLWRQVAETVHEQVARSIEQYRDNHGGTQLRLFGLGVEVGAPVKGGMVIPVRAALSNRTRTKVDLGGLLRREFDADKTISRPFPIIVENDINALAVRALHESDYTESNLVVAAVFDEGIGGGLVMDGRLRRGSAGFAMEIGHLTVGFPPGGGRDRLTQDLRRNRKQAESAKADRSDHIADDIGECHCGGYGHVETLATPRGLCDRLRINSIGDADALDPVIAHHEFARGGASLGRALSHVLNIVNPGRLIVYAPAALMNVAPGSAAAEYLAAARIELDEAFAVTDQPRDNADFVSLPTEPGDLNRLGAHAAAVCVVEAFIEHALGLDNCVQLGGPNHLPKDDDEPLVAAG